MRHRLPEMGIDEQMAWGRLRSAIGDHRGHEASDVAFARLEQARDDGDESVLVAAARMLPDHLTAVDGQLEDHRRHWLDAVAGGPNAAAAVVLDRERRRGVLWVETAVNAVRSEIEQDSNLAATVVPTREGGVIQPGDPPDYLASANEAAAAAGAR